MLKNKNRILILIPGKNARGGITTYYQTLMPLFSMPIDFLERGARNWPVRSGFYKESIRIVKDYFRFIRAVSTGKYSLVLTNTSFSSLAVLRDGLYLLIARIYKLKTITFYRGWDYKFSEKIERKYLKIFKYVYFKSEALIELAQKNIDILKKWGYENQIFLETGVVNSNLLEGINEKQITKKYNYENLNLLFLARLEKTKGIYEAIDTFIILKQRYLDFKMIIAGDGEETDNIRQYIQITKAKNVILTGFVNGKAKGDIFTSADVYLFPSYSEGMPSSLIEAMAFGLSVITSSAGVISDFFINGKNGYITDSKDPVLLASLVELIIVDREKAKTMALNNYKLAKEKFYSDKVVMRLEAIISSVLNG